MKKIKVEKLPIEVLEKVKILGNVFDEAEKRKENFDKMVCGLSVVLREKYNITAKQWNDDIAPELRKYFD